MQPRNEKFFPYAGKARTPSSAPPFSRRGSVASVEGKIRQALRMRRRGVRVSAPTSSFAGFRFPRDVIMIVVRWYLRYGLSYRDVDELLANVASWLIT
jgi:hypothetical protein